MRIHPDHIWNLNLHNIFLDGSQVEVHLHPYVADYLERFPEEDETINKFKKDLLFALNQDLQKSPAYVFQGQRYKQRVYASSDRTSWYDLVWDVGVLQEMIQTERLVPQRLSVSALYSSQWMKGEIQENQLPEALVNEEPIMLIEIPFIPEQCLIITGHHLVTSRVQAGIDEVWGYVLDRHQHLHGMPLWFHQRLYMFHEVLMGELLGGREGWA